MKKIYVCSSLKQENYDYVTKLLKRLPKAIHLRPYLDQPGNKLNHIEIDVAMIHHCDELWVVGKYGRDCSWEIGYATGIGKPVVIYKDEINKKLVEEDWMIMHALNKGVAVIEKVADNIFDSPYGYEVGGGP